jgi:hypothetical protein
MISANADLTPKWKLGVSTGYDFVQNGVTYTQLRFERDLLSWRMDFNWTPFKQMPTGILYWNKIRVLSDIKGTNEVQIHRVKHIKSNQLISAVFTH